MPEYKTPDRDTRKTPSKLECVTCHRCGGGGIFRCFSHVNAGRCFRCNGRGWTYTKRGAAAAEYLRNLVTLRADEVEPGMTILIDGIDCINLPSKWMRVKAVETVADYGKRRPSGADEWETLTGVRFTFDGLTPAAGTPGTAVTPSDTAGYEGSIKLMRKWHDAAEREAGVAAALAYQDTLTKGGTPRKRQAA